MIIERLNPAAVPRGCPFQYPIPVQLASNLFLPGGFELARYAESKVEWS